MLKIIVLLGILFFSLTIPVFPSEQSKAKFDSATSLYKNGKLQEAIEKARESISLDPEISVPYTFLGNIYNELKNPEEAERYFKKAIEVDPKDGGALNGLGLIYSEKGLRDKSIEFFKRAKDVAPEYYGVYVNLGKEYFLVFEGRGDPDYLNLSKESLEKAIKLNENSYDSYGYLGKVFIALKEYEKAIEALEKSISLNPNAKERYYDDLSGVYYDLASAYYNKGMYREAIENTLESLKIFPDAPDTVFLLGLSYLYSGNREEANAQYLKLNKIDIKMASVLVKEIEKKEKSKPKDETIKTDQEFNDFTTYYYLSPQPDKAPQALKYFLNSKLFRDNIKTNGHVIEMVAYFFGRVADINPSLLREYEKFYGSEDMHGKLFLISIFTFASDEQNKQFFRERLATEKSAEITNVLNKIIDLPPAGNKRILKGVINYNDLDFFWMEFFVTGDKEPINKLIDALSWEDKFKAKLTNWMTMEHVPEEKNKLSDLLNNEIKISVDFDKNKIDYEGDIDCFYSVHLQSYGWQGKRSNVGIQVKQILGLSEQDLLYMATKGAAMWALQSNAKQHKRVLEFCREEFDTRTNKSKIELAIIIELASKK